MHFLILFLYLAFVIHTVTTANVALHESIGYKRWSKPFGFVTDCVNYYFTYWLKFCSVSCSVYIILIEFWLKNISAFRLLQFGKLYQDNNWIRRFEDIKYVQESVNSNIFFVFLWIFVCFFLELCVNWNYALIEYKCLRCESTRI